MIPRWRIPLLAALLAASGLLLPGAAAAQFASTRHTPVLPDPVPGQGVGYPPSAATATEAYGGPPLRTLHNDCTEFNPCAMPSSAPREAGELEASSK